MTDAPGPRPTRRERDETRRGGGLARAARVVVAPIISGAVGAIVFLVVIQWFFRQGHTTLDFNHVLGTMIEGETQEVSSTDTALGVIGDSVGPTGLRATILCGIVLMVLHEAVVTRVVRRHWLIQAVPLWIVTSLAVGVLYTSLADARLDTPVGFFGVDAGALTPLVIVLSSLAFAVIGARAHDLATTAAWWEKRPDPLAETNLEEVAGLPSARTTAD